MWDTEALEAPRSMSMSIEEESKKDDEPSLDAEYGRCPTLDG